MRAIFLLCVCLTLGGCFGGSLGLQGMTPEQIAQAAKIKDSTLSCISGVYAGATISAIWINADKGAPTVASVKPNCEVTFSQPPQK